MWYYNERNTHSFCKAPVEAAGTPRTYQQTVVILSLSYLYERFLFISEHRSTRVLSGHQVRHASGYKVKLLWPWETRHRHGGRGWGLSLIKVGDRREERLCLWMHRASWKCTEVEAKPPRGSLQSLESRQGTRERILLHAVFFFFFKLYIIVFVLPNIKMNPPQVYMCSPFWTLLPPPCSFYMSQKYGGWMRVPSILKY